MLTGQVGSLKKGERGKTSYLGVGEIVETTDSGAGPCKRATSWGTDIPTSTRSSAEAQRLENCRRP